MMFLMSMKSINTWYTKWFIGVFEYKPSTIIIIVPRIMTEICLYKQTIHVYVVLLLICFNK